MHCLLMLLALAAAHVHAAPVDPQEQGSCTDPQALKAAELALNEINLDRTEGYVLALRRLSNTHLTQHGDNGVVFYLTLDVQSTNCSVHSRREYKSCRSSDIGFYGQCKAAIFIDRVKRVVRLYKYRCFTRPVSSKAVIDMLPDAPTYTSVDQDEVKSVVAAALEKFNKESNLKKRFALLKVESAKTGHDMMTGGMHISADFSIQETTCTKDTQTPDNCPNMDCEFAHKGFCKASQWPPMDGETRLSVDCEIYEPEAALREHKLHLLGGEIDHSHNDTKGHTHDHDHAHAADDTHTHDHVHDHTKSHAQHDKTHQHADDSAHHHTHDHAAGSPHRHAHAHSHDHGHGHDHVHAHHAKAHDHSGDSPNHHHAYQHPADQHTHEHDHELALDHDHKHAHLHEHEHHHHHHDHTHESTAHSNPLGFNLILPPLDDTQPPPALPDDPADPTKAATPSGRPDPEIPGQDEPVVLDFPSTLSSQCVPPLESTSIISVLMQKDPIFTTIN